MARNRPDKIDIEFPDAIRGRRGRMFARSRDAGYRADENTIEIFDEIGPEGVTDKWVASRLSDIPGDVNVKINSPGGAVDHGVAIFNLLVAHPGAVNVEVIGVAASAASLIAMAGDRISIAKNAHVMLHQVWGLTVGNSGDHIKQADTLSHFDASLARTYAARTGQPLKAIVDMMESETWLDGEAAIRAGFADEILKAPARAVAQFDLSAYARAPQSLSKPLEQSSEYRRIESRSQLERDLKDKLGLANAAARKIAVAGWASIAGQPQTEFDALAESVAQARAAVTKKIKTGCLSKI